MSKAQPLKIRKTVEQLKAGDYVQFLYPQLSKQELEEQIKNNINTKYRDYLEIKNRKNKLLNIYTDKTIYQVKNQTVFNMIDRMKKQTSVESIEKELKTVPFTVHPQVVDKFKNRNIKKIEEVIRLFIDEGQVQAVKENQVEMIHKHHDIILVIDFHHYVILNAMSYRRRYIPNNSIVIQGEKMKLNWETSDNDIKIDVFLNQLNLLRSNIMDEAIAIEDIEHHFKKIDIDQENNTLLVYTENGCYHIQNYNIIKAEPVFGFSLGKVKKTAWDGFVWDEEQKKFASEKPILDFYGSLQTARKYLYSTGLSIKVITKFITENNIQDLYTFLMEDILYYGFVLYDNYYDNCMIIKTRRFYYLLKNNVIINIRSILQQSIPECSISFQKIYQDQATDKTEILDLEIGDRVRDYLTYQTINNLIMKDHAKERYLERVSKKVDTATIEILSKQDIYKNGTVYMGTYYNNTKLIKGLKNVYIIDNTSIISVWKINPVIDYIGERYQNMIEEINLTEVADSDIL